MSKNEKYCTFDFDITYYISEINFENDRFDEHVLHVLLNYRSIARLLVVLLFLF